MKKERILYLDVLKAISIILVVLGHCIQYGSGRSYSLGAFFENPLFKFIYSFHMPLFMLISGYLFAYSVANKKWYQLLLSRFKHLIVPLFSWSVISLLFSIALLVAGGASNTISIIWILKNLISGFMNGPWFLWAVWWNSLIIIIVRTFFKDNPIIYAIISLLTFVIPDILNFSHYCFMWPYFFLSYIFNTYDLKDKLRHLFLNKFVIASFFIVFALFLYFYNYDSYIYTSGFSILHKDAINQICIDCFRFITGLVGSISVMYFVFAAIKIMPKTVLSIMTYLGQNTLGIYLVSNAANQFLLKFTSSLSSINYLYTFIETVSMLCLSLVVTVILKKCKITNMLLLGNK